MNPILQKVQKGMRVLDQEQNEIGTVDYVKFGDEDPRQPGTETAGVNPIADDTQDSLIENVFEVFAPDELPREIQERMIRDGFIRIDAHGLFNADRYVLPEQIQFVSENEVKLNVTKSELIKRS